LAANELKERLMKKLALVLAACWPCPRWQGKTIDLKLSIGCRPTIHPPVSAAKQWAAGIEKVSNGPHQVRDPPLESARQRLRH
jgi:hypothetical protein